VLRGRGVVGKGGGERKGGSPSRRCKSKRKSWGSKSHARIKISGGEESQTDKKGGERKSLQGKKDGHQRNFDLLQTAGR